VLWKELWRRREEDIVVVSPDVGGVVRARAMAKHLGSDLAIIDKRRPKANVAKVMHIIGEVKDRCCVLIDDLVDTAGTLCEAAGALKESGATGVLACCTHPVLSGNAVQKITDSELDELMVTDSIPLGEEAQACEKIRQLTVSELLGEAIRRVAESDSVSSLFVD
jgi:ribose-phosphate pyrophosphokinase